ncbi:ulp1 protease family, C-terminal catalytic domain-containing protein, putative [Eimeria brunetti]|uniref:Ulp1 protease family, C-terminal catalytic domain-containing protein, putative n=1 Tax=Eimeria brunetti TaxID=51314 RepID=U6LI78_9EIME|nr:ulp1 protease family, C-terminal catalytic domain-containing protein, putative [Eimeria brunetti]
MTGGKRAMEGEHRPQAYKAVDLAPATRYIMEIPKLHDPSIPSCPPGATQSAVLSVKEQRGSVLPRTPDCSPVPPQQLQHLAFQGDLAASKASGAPSSESPPVVTEPRTGVQSRHEGNGISPSCRIATRLDSSRMQHNSQTLGPHGPERHSAAAPAGSSLESIAEVSLWAVEKTGKAPAGVQRSAMLIGGSGGPSGSCRDEFGETQHRCGSSHGALSQALPPVGCRRDQMEDLRIASASRHHNLALLTTRARDFHINVGAQGPPRAVSEAAAARGTSNVPPAHSTPSTGGSMVTRSQTATALLSEVVRIEDSSDEEEGPAAARKHGIHAPMSEAQGNGQRTLEAADGNSTLNSLFELSRGVMKSGTEPVTAFVILVAALVQGDGDCCVLSAEALSRAGAECALLQPPQPHRGSAGGVPTLTEAAGNRLRRLRQPDRTYITDPRVEGQLISSHPIALEAACSCCCTESSEDRRSRHAKNKNRKHTRTHTTKTQATVGENQAGVDHQNMSNRLNLPPIVDNSGARSGEASFTPVSGASSANGGGVSAPGSPSADTTQPINVGPREDTSGPSSGAAAAHEYERLQIAKKEESSTRSGANHNSKEPERSLEALGKRSSGGHRKRQSKSSSTNEPSSSSQSQQGQKCTRERKERHCGGKGSLGPCLGPGNASRGDSSPRQPTGALLVEEKQVPGTAVPRNALIVTDGKPLHVMSLPSSDVTPPAVGNSTHFGVRRDDTQNKGERDSSSNGYGTPDGTDYQNLGSQQHLAGVPSRPENILASGSSGNQEKQPKEKEATQGHCSFRELRSEGASTQETKVYCGSNTRCSKCLKVACRHTSSQEGRAVPIVCLELHQSQANKLHCSGLLQKVLEQERNNNIGCVASSFQGGRSNTGNLQGEIPKTSGSFSDPQQSTAHSKSSRLESSHTKKERSSKCNKSSSDSNDGISSPRNTSSGFEGSSSINSSVNSNSSSDNKMAHGRCQVSGESRTERVRGAANRRHSSSTGKRSSGTRSSTSKHERSSSSRRRCRSSSSRRKKLRREMPSNSTVETTATGYREELCRSPVGSPLPLRGVCDDETAPCGSTQFTQMSRNTASPTGNSVQGGARQRCHFRDGSSPETADSAPALEPATIGEKLSAAIKATDESSLRMPMGSSKQRGTWLLLCIGPALHVNPPAEKAGRTQAGKQRDFQLVGATPVVQSARYSSPRDQRSNESGTMMQLWEEKVPTGSKDDFLCLVEALLPPNLVDEAPLYRWRGTGAAGEPIDIADLAAFFTGFSAKHTKIPSEVLENSDQKLPKAVPRVSRMLREFFMSSLGPWKALRKGRMFVSSFSIERLVSCWRARGLHALADSSVVAGMKYFRNARMDTSAPLSICAPAKADIQGQASARRATSASSPVFDLLLDDRSLRRLSEKEFLDDTIIDFCLGFIVDHILTPEERLRVHISNTFFLSALMEQKCEMEAHTRLTRWLKKEVTPLPKKDFIFIPVHHKHQHWSLAVVAYPWRALNPSKPNAEGGIVRTASEKSVCKRESSKPVDGIQPPYQLDVPVHQAGVKGPLRSPTLGRTASFLIEKCGEVDLGITQASLKTSGQHAQKPSPQKARLFHVDSMGLRSVFDRCRGRLKRFLRREFEHRCGGELKSGEKVELCTDSCCWHDGHSCTLHTPRQQNGYDCGVFVVEYVFFLTRNLSAIETLLVGPSRDCLTQQRYARQPAAGPFTSSSYGCLGRVDTPVETRCQGKLLEAALGFHCHCMEAGIPAQMPSGAGSTYGLTYNLKARLAELRQAHAALFGSSRGVISRQRELELHSGTPPTPISASQGEGATEELTPQPVEKIRCPVRPHEAPGLHERQDLTGVIRQPDIRRSTDGRAASKQQCPMWGPLPLHISKRRSSHTKWFSQDRVTERRSQLHKMLLFMRQNIRWREDPKLIAHLKSLFLNIDTS